MGTDLLIFEFFIKKAPTWRTGLCSMKYQVRASLNLFAGISNHGLSVYIVSCLYEVKKMNSKKSILIVHQPYQTHDEPL